MTARLRAARAEAESRAQRLDALTEDGTACVAVAITSTGWLSLSRCAEPMEREALLWAAASLDNLAATLRREAGAA